jgi:GT2 family glycosyltransferase
MPFFFVIIPTCNRPRQLSACLECLRPGTQTLAADQYEIIVSDDAAGRHAENALAPRFPFVRWAAGPARGPAANRNHGARLAAGDWLVFLDDDCLPEPAWLDGFQREILRSNAGLIEGRTVSLGNTGHPLEERVENPSGGLFWSCNLAVKRDLFVRSGGFDEDFQEPAFEDMEFAERMRGSGVTTAFTRDAVVGHPVRQLSIKQLWRRALMVRWLCLYHLKTRGGILERNGFSRAFQIATEQSANFLRIQWKAVRTFNSGEWRRELFLLGWRTATFPVVLPWMIFWDARFRRQLSKQVCRRTASAKDTKTEPLLLT